MTRSAWTNLKSRNNSWTSGFLSLFLCVLLLFLVKAAFNGTGSPADSCEGAIFVQIDGDIRYPGVYFFDKGPGLSELVEKGGGMTSGSALPQEFENIQMERLAKATVRRDGNEWVFLEEEISAFHKITLGIPVSLNSESEEGLTAIPGIGPGLAGIIVSERRKRGGFRDLNEIKSLHGIGNKVYEKITPYVTL